MWNEINLEVEAPRTSFVSQNHLNPCAQQNLNVFFHGSSVIARHYFSSVKLSVVPYWCTVSWHGPTGVSTQWPWQKHYYTKKTPSFKFRCILTQELTRKCLTIHEMKDSQQLQPNLLGSEWRYFISMF